MSFPEVPDWLHAFEFQRLDRGPFAMGAPDLRDNKWADGMARAITEEFAVRRRAEGYDGNRSPLQWLKPVCYNAILTAFHYEAFEDLEARITRFQRVVRGPQVDRSIFATGIMGIFAHDVPKARLRKEDPRPMTDEKSRKRLADEMWWGFRHYAEPTELNDFNRKWPLHRKSSTEDYLVPDLYEKIVTRRFAFHHFDYGIEGERGKYPAAVESAVEERHVAAKKARKTMVQQTNEDW